MKITEEWSKVQITLKAVAGKFKSPISPAAQAIVSPPIDWRDVTEAGKAINILQAVAEKELRQPVRTFLKILFRRSTVVSLNTLFNCYARTNKSTCN